MGHHFNSEALAAKIAAESPELLKKILVIDFDLQNHPRIRAIGMDVVYGDISNSEVLRHFGVSEAKVVVCTIGDTFLRGTSNEELLGVVKSINPDARVITTASVRQIIDGTAVSGAWACISPEIESATAYLAAIRKALKS